MNTWSCADAASGTPCTPAARCTDGCGWVAPDAPVVDVAWICRAGTAYRRCTEAVSLRNFPEHGRCGPAPDAPVVDVAELPQMLRAMWDLPDVRHAIAAAGMDPAWLSDAADELDARRAHDLNGHLVAHAQGRNL